jgi:tetratricopeptide (TPR) repeat protein
MRNWQLLITVFGVWLILAGCVSSGGSSGGRSTFDVDEDLANLESSSEFGGGNEGGSAGLSPNNAIFTFSLSNNGMTGKAVNKREAQGLANRIGSQVAKNSPDLKRELTNVMALKRFAGANLNEIFGVAKAIITNEMKKDVSRKLPEQTELELALGAIESRKIAMAEHWLNQISDTRNKRMKAAELTARGIIALMDNRLPEAVDFWYQALKNFPNYTPAKLNLGFTALRFGDYTTAKKMLSDHQDDWFAATGLMQAERLANNVNRVVSLCKRILSQVNNYKPARFSCALNTYQGQGDLAKARKELESVARINGGPPEIDEKVFLVIGRIDKALRQQRAANANKQRNNQNQKNPQNQNQKK